MDPTYLKAIHLRKSSSAFDFSICPFQNIRIGHLLPNPIRVGSQVLQKLKHVKPHQLPQESCVCVCVHKYKIDFNKT